MERLIKKIVIIGLIGIIFSPFNTKAADGEFDLLHFMPGILAAAHQKRVDAEFSIDYTYLQHRTYQDATSTYPYSLWMQVSVDGDNARTNDFSNVKIYASSGNELPPINTPELYVDKGGYPVCDCRSGACTTTTSSGESGFSVYFASLPADTYTITVDTYGGETLDTQLEFPGTVELPVIQSSSITVFDVEDGTDGKVTWTNPTTEDNWSQVDEIRLFMYDAQGNTNMIIKVSPDAESVTIPAEAITAADALGDYPMTLVIQTRAYDENYMHYSRGYSSEVTVE